MKILFIGFPPIVQPWFDDFVQAVNGKHIVTLHDPQKGLEEQFRGLDFVVDQGGSLGTREMIDLAVAEGVKLWQIIGTGLDHVDVDYFQQKGLPLANTPGEFSAIALAEHALFLMFSMAKQLKPTLHNVEQQIWYTPVNFELEGKTLGMVGFGASARELARRARALGMRTMAVDINPIPRGQLNEMHLDHFGPVEELDQILNHSDYVSIHTPLTPATHHMINAQSFRKMKPTAFIINVARGQIIDESALIEALQKGLILGAGLDVTEQEPMNKSNPLLKMDNVLITPHIAGGTYGTSMRRGMAAAENIERVIRGLPPLYQITTPNREKQLV